MPVERYVEVYSAIDDTTYRVREQDLKQVATQELGMIEGPFELNIFTKTILATALQREQITRNGELQKAMTEGGDWKSALKNVGAVTELMEKLGVDDANWSPTAGGQVVPPAIKAQPSEPVSGSQESLDLDGQVKAGF